MEEKLHIIDEKSERVNQYYIPEVENTCSFI